MNILIILLYCVMVVLIIKKMNDVQLVSPLFWLLVTWGFVFVAWLFSGLKYNYEISNNAFVYILFNIMCFGVSYFVSFHTKWGKKEKKYKNTDGRVNLQVAVIISVLGMLLCLGTHLSASGFTFGARDDDFSASFLSNIGTYASLLGLYVWIYCLIDSIVNDNTLKIHHFVCLIAGVSGSLVTGNRWGVFYALFSTLLAYLYGLKLNKKYKYNKYVVFGVLFIVIAAVFYFDYVIKVRFGVRDMITMYNNVFNTYMSKDTLVMLDHIGPFRRIVEQMIYYFSQEISWFGQIYDSYDFGLSYGAYEFHYIARRFGSLATMYNDACINVSNVGSNYAIRAGVYRTVLGSLIVDFGKRGTCVIVIILGWLSAKSRKKYIKSKSIEHVTNQIIICLGMVFSVISSPFADGWAFIFYWMLLVPILNRFYFKKVKKKDN